MNATFQELRAFAAAMMFFTRLPGLSRVRVESADLQRAITYFPMMGWVVGGVAAVVCWLAALAWPPAVASGLSLAATLLLTGALHEDGWADVCDGFGGGHTRERILAIMKDSRIGAFGVIGLMVLLGLRWQVVAALPVELAPAVLVAAHSVSRGAAASVMATLDYARPVGDPSKARALVGRLRGRRLFAVMATALGPMVLLPVAAWNAVAVAMIARMILTRWFSYRLGGYTGDCLGATQQVAEVAFYLTISAVL